MNNKKTIFSLTLLLSVLLFSSIVFAQLDPKDSEKITTIEKTTDEIKQISDSIFENTRYNLKFFGTEYQPSAPATAWIQLLNGNDDPINDASCLGNIISPDKTFFFNNFVYTHLNITPEGIYFFDFTAGTDIGVYMMTAICFFGVDDVQQEFADSQDLISGTQGGNNDFEDLFSDNGKYLRVKEVNSSILYRLNYTGIVVSPLANVSEIDFIFNGRISPSSAVDEAVISIFNFTSGEFVDFANRVPAQSSDADITNAIFDTSGNLANDLIKDGNITIQFNDTNKTESVTSINDLFNDVSIIQIKSGNGTIVEVRGASESHVDNVAITTAVIVQTIERLHNTNLCLDEFTLQHNISLQITPAPAFEVIEIEQCPFGCDLNNNECNPNPSTQIIIFLAILVILIIVGIVLMKKAGIG